MDIPRPSMKVDASSGKHGSDVAGETAAALAASSVVFRDTGKWHKLRLDSPSIQPPFVWKIADRITLEQPRRGHEENRVTN